MMKTLLVSILLTFSACGIKIGNNSDFTVPLNPTQCQALPSEASIDPATSGCTTSSGLWTRYDLTVENNRITGEKNCNVSGAGDPPANQSAFNAYHSTTSQVSDEDFYGAATCASGSTFVSSAGGYYYLVYIWTVSP
jgi:hypothetical protein